MQDNHARCNAKQLVYVEKHNEGTAPKESHRKKHAKRNTENATSANEIKRD